MREARRHPAPRHQALGANVPLSRNFLVMLTSDLSCMIAGARQQLDALKANMG